MWGKVGKVEEDGFTLSLAVAERTYLFILRCSVHAIPPQRSAATTLTLLAERTIT
jgi:hypothetical protein